MAKALRGLPTIVVGMLCVAVLFTAYTAQNSLANHEPAQKTGAAGSDVDEIRPEGDHVILEDTIRVSSSQDAIISVTAECSILTSLITGDDEGPVDHDNDPATPDISQDSATSFGEVQIYVTLDGQKLPVTYTDAGNVDEPDGVGGEVVFCNRAYQRTVQDDHPDNDEGCPEDDPATTEEDESNCGNDLDTERDFIETRTANGFNWLAKDIGFNYDDGADGNNLVTVQVHAVYDFDADDPATVDTTELQCPDTAGQERTCSEAYVGSRTLIIEPTNVAIHEAVTNPDGVGN